MKTITIKSKIYTLKYTIRALFVFENITNHSFEFGRLMDEYILLYSVLLANNEGFDVSFADFITACDEDPYLFVSFREWLVGEFKRMAQLQAEPDVKKKTTKKAKK